MHSDLDPIFGLWSSLRRPRQPGTQGRVGAQLESSGSPKDHNIIQ